MSALEIAAPSNAARGVPQAVPSLDAFFEARAADVDAGRATVREGLAKLGEAGLPTADIVASVALVSSVARSDLATAFSAWAHRMVIDYVSLGPDGSAVRAHLRRLANAQTLGATALAAGTANVLAGAPLPVTYREDGDDLVLDGRIPWASNLIAPFLVVTAAAHHEDPRQAIVVAVGDDVEGLEPAPFPALLALGATGSTTVKLAGVRVPRAAIIADDLPVFVSAVLPRFLLLQGAFCSGLANRSIEEATTNLGPMGAGLRPRIDETASAIAAADEHAARLAAAAALGEDIATTELLALRLRWSELTTTAVQLELAATGGRGYLAGSPTARRVREAAFLPIQAPTEVLLRWLLSHSR